MHAQQRQDDDFQKMVISSVKWTKILDLKVSKVFTCLMSEGRKLHNLAAKYNRQSPLVLIVNFGTVSMRVSSEEQTDLGTHSADYCLVSRLIWYA